MAKLAPNFQPAPSASLPGGNLLLRLRSGEKRQALSITWPTIPDDPRIERRRIPPRPNRRLVQPVVFGDFETSE